MDNPHDAGQFAVDLDCLVPSGILCTVAKGEISVMAEENKSYGVAWFLAGLGVGALVGILYAPKSGRETREDIAQAPARAPSIYASARARLRRTSAQWSTRARNM